MSTYSVVIIDNKQNSIKLMQNYVDRFFPDVSIIGTAQNIDEGIQLVRDLDPDAVLVDIHVDEYNPFHVLDELKPFDIEIVVLSAHKEFAIKAIKYEIADYVLKPIELEQISNAIHKVIKKVRAKKYIQNLEIEASSKKAHALDIVALPTASKIELARVKDILFCEAQGRYTIIHLSEDQVVTTKNLREYDDKLVKKGFYRIHNSYLINLSKLKHIYREDGRFVCAIEGYEKPIPIAKRKSESLQRFLKLRE